MDISSSPSTAAITAPHTHILYGRDMPPGSILCAVDCAADPLNVLRPVEKILEIMAARRSEIGPDKKLVVLMGEAHSMPTRKALQALLMQRLTEAGEKFTVNFELPHNYWSMIAAQEMSLTVPKGLYYKSCQYDQNGYAILSANLAYMVPTMSRVSTLNIMALCHALKLPVCFNDAARTREHTLDLKDPFTRQAAENYFTRVQQNMQQDIGDVFPEGSAVRNSAMARLAIEHAAYHHANLILQSTGVVHGIGGDCFYHYPFEHSLYHHFTAAGASVLVVVPTSQEFGLNNIPHEAAEALRSHVIAVDGLAEDEFGKYKAMNPSLDAEWAFLNQINKASGGKMNLVNVPGNRDIYKKEVLRQARNLIRRYKRAESKQLSAPAATLEP